MSAPDPRAAPQAFLRALFDRAVAVSDPMEIVPPKLAGLQSDRIVVVGGGKASARMAEAVEATLGPCRGLVVTRHGHARPLGGIRCVEAGHPVPDAAGEAATRRMLEICGALGPSDHALVLISGGGSALMAAPAPGLTLDDKVAVTEALLSSGAPIAEINLVRKHLSRVKGGQLAAACHPAQVTALMISDVPGDDPGAIASGPTVGEARGPGAARSVLDRWGIAVPDRVARHLAGASGVVAPDDPRLARTRTRVIAAPAQALEAAAAMARDAGLTVEMLGDALEGEARDLGRAHARMAIGGGPRLILSGGECTVARRGDGVGGPNAEYVLAAALELRGRDGIHVLACDTDGVDGAAEIAGAVAGPGTLTRARDAGLDLRAALERNDAHRFFEATGGQVVTGPTLTNVNDFRAILVL